MKILLLDVNYGHSSTGKLVYHLQDHFESQGHEVLVCYGRNSKDQVSGAKKISADLEVYAHAGLARLTGWNGFFSPFSTSKLIKTIIEFEPDIVHLHELHGYYVNSSSLINFLKRRNIPTVWTFHCEIMYTGNCGYAYDCEKWKESCGGCPNLHDYPNSLFFDFTRQMLEKKKLDFHHFPLLHIVSVSEWLAERVENSFLSGRDSSVVHNGVDTQRIFKPRDTKHLRKNLGIVTDDVIVTIAPNVLSDRKGGQWILRLAEHFKDESVTFVLVGVEGSLESNKPNVIFLPATDDQNLLACYYSLGSFFLLPSKKETFSLTCVESLACGTPILGFECGAPTIIAPKGYGKFVSYGNFDALAELVSESLNNRESFFSKSECSGFASKRYSLANMGDKYIEVFRNLLERC